MDFENEKRSAESGGFDTFPVDTRPATESPMMRLDSKTPISYLYLTFDTELPTVPASQNPDEPDNGKVPPCPSMVPYVSPLEWGTARKSVLLVISCIATFLTAYSAGSYSPPSKIMAEDLGASHVGILAGITTFCLGFALAPMALAPISEIWGRYPIFVITGTVYVIFQAVCSVVTNLAGMLVARFLVGVGGSVFSAVIGGVIADVWTKEKRNTAMALFSGSVLAGTGAGPLVSAALIETLDDDTQAWKWSFWHQVIIDGVLVLVLILFFRETRGSVVLRKKAKKLNDWYEKLENAGVYGLSVSDPEKTAVDTTTYSTDSTLRPGPVRRIRWLIKEDEERVSIGKMITTSIRRPFHLLFTEPVVFCFSLWAAFSWGILYLSFAVVPYLYSSDFGMSSRVYIAMIAASAAATVVGVLQEQLLKHPQWRKQGSGGVQYTNSKFWAFMRKNFPAESPEARLYFSCITAMLLPAGLYGAFLCPPSMEGYSVAVGLGFATWGIYSVYLASFNYLADTYHIYASSALAAQSCCRNIIGGCFPLITSIMFKNLGLKGAGGMLGGIATALTVIPWVLVFFGERIRARSKVAISLQK